MTDTQAVQRRLGDLQQRFRANDIDIGFVLEHRNRYYLTGTGLWGIVLVPADGDPIHLVRLNLQRAQEESAIADVRPFEGMSSLRRIIVDHASTNPVVGIEKDVVPVAVYERYDEILDASFVDIASHVLALRRRKSEPELDLIEAAADISNTVLESVPQTFSPGMTEVELQARLRRRKRTAGAESGVWSRAWDQRTDFGIVVSGPESAVISGYWASTTGSGACEVVPWGPSRRRIQEGDVVIVDHVTNYQGYHSDEARTFVVGEPTDRHRAVHDVLVEALEAAASAVRPGNRISDIYDAAYEIARSSPHGDQFMGLEQVGFEYVGHQVGLDIDEEPLITPGEETDIEPGMVFAIEPKFIFDDEALSIEDTLVATEDGSRRLTTTPRKLFTI